ncbi:hypothetical protein SCALM49S_05965 [Streptomyces californicus]
MAGVDQGLVVAVLVAGADPQPAVQVEVQGVAVGAGQDDLLHPGLHGDPHLVPVDRPARGPLEVVDEHGGRRQHGDHRDVGQDEEPPERALRSRRNTHRTSAPPAAALTEPVNSVPVNCPSIGSSRKGKASPPTSAPT